MKTALIAKQAFAAGAAWWLTAGGVLAQTITDGYDRHYWWWDGDRYRYHQVPEIDASAGLLAVAAALATLALAFELRRRRKGGRG